MEDKRRHFRWIVGFIILNVEEASWVVGGLGVVLKKIEKHTNNLEAKACWTLACHRLCPTTWDNVLNLIRPTLIAFFMAGYEFDMGEFLPREKKDQVVGGEKQLLVYLCILTRICFTVGV